MSLKIHTFFDYATPFSAATTEREMAEIMSLKYPKACSLLETSAEFFERMVADVRKYEAWKFIGLESFDAFCSQKLGKTIEEVEEIVIGVRALQSSGHRGPIPEQKAKEASRSARAAEMVRAGTHTQAQAAREVGIDRAAVCRALTKEVLTPKESTQPPPIVRLTLDPALTAANIRAKMGAEYAARLKEVL